MSTSIAPKRPKPSIAMSHDEIMAFLKTGKPAVVCAPDSNGRLVARMVPFELVGNHLATAVDLSLSGDATDLPAGDGACVIIDTYPSYDRIKGVLLRGSLTIAGIGDNRKAALHVEHANGFDFEKLRKH